MNGDAAPVSLPGLRDWIARRDNLENPIVAVHEAALSALIEAVEAAHDHIFVAHKPGDIAPYRRVQAAFMVFGLEVDPHGD